jgi:hypothetical protein
MLPTTYQLPAGIVLVAAGLLACFAGYRLFRLVLGVYGFILGAMLASSLMGATDTASMLVAAGVGGLIGAVVLILAYFIGVALVGAGLGALLAHLIWAQLGTEPHAIVVIGFSIAGALASLALQRYVIIFATAFGGAWTALIGGLALMGNRAAATAAVAAAEQRNVWLFYPWNPAPGEQWVFIAWIALGIVGLVTQLGFTAKGRP